MGESHTPADFSRPQVDVGIFGDFVCQARANFKKDRICSAAVDQRVAICDACLEGRRITWAQDRLALVFDQRGFAFAA